MARCAPTGGTKLDAMRARLNGLRAALAATHPRLSAIADQRGMFAMLPLTPEAVAALREGWHLYGWERTHQHRGPARRHGAGFAQALGHTSKP